MVLQAAEVAEPHVVAEAVPRTLAPSIHYGLFTQSPQRVHRERETTQIEREKDRGRERGRERERRRSTVLGERREK